MDGSTPTRRTMRDGQKDGAVKSMSPRKPPESMEAEKDDESEWAAFLSPEARRRYRELREGRLDVEAELTRIYDELEADGKPVSASRERWVKPGEGR